jgi:NDP-sugar pyrophosphorylase family protein
MRLLTIVAVSFILILSCKENTNSAKSTQKADESTEVKDTQNMEIKGTGKPVPAAPVNVPALYIQAEAILKFREENSPTKYAIIDVGVWTYDGIFKNGQMLKPAEVEGRWMDFDQYGKYEYGVKSQIQGKGRFHYDNGKSTLLLLNDDKSKKPEEYNVRLVNGIMIIQGMDTYMDNGFQAKLSKVSARPN